MARRVPSGPPPPPVVMRVRLRYAKRGRLRFSSHRDFARAFERALRRAQIPVAYSAGFSPHPKISYIGAAPTGVSSEAEYVEIGLARELDPDDVRVRVDAALPQGLDITEAVRAGSGSLADRIEASAWLIELPGVSREQAMQALELFVERQELTVERVTKSGRRSVDVRAAVVHAEIQGAASAADDPQRAIIELVIRQVTPAVRPDDVITALHAVAGLALTAPPLAVRQAQGPLGEHASIGDPLAPDRAEAASS